METSDEDTDADEIQLNLRSLLEELVETSENSAYGDVAVVVYLKSFTLKKI